MNQFHRVIARCAVCATELQGNTCPTCAAMARLKATAEVTGNLRGRPAARVRRVNPQPDLPVRGQDAALPPGDRE